MLTELYPPIYPACVRRIVLHLAATYCAHCQIWIDRGRCPCDRPPARVLLEL